MAAAEHTPWRRRLAAVDARMAVAVEAMLDGLVGPEPVLPHRQREVLAMAVAAAVRDGEAVRRHAIEAMHYGATDAELLEALATVAVSAGRVAFADALEAMGDLLTPAGDPAA